MNLMPWRVRRFSAWLYANRCVPVSLWRRRMRKPKRSIMISTAFFGGVGGTEKHLKALVESMSDCAFDIRAREIRVSGFLPNTCNYTVNWPVTFGGYYDLYLYFAGGGKPNLELGRFEFGATMVDTNGANVRDIEQLFDHIAVQTANLDRYCNNYDKCVLAFPNVPATFPRNRSAVSLPERYFLTVFNPFADEFKGTDTLYRVADYAALPIVWFFSDKSGFDFASLPVHSNVIQLKNLKQEELYYAYEHASAYVSFSHLESFGWSLAEAFYNGLPIISREVGFLTHVKEQPGIHIYDNEDMLRKLLKSPLYERHHYDDTVFVENTYSHVIDRILLGTS
jgi:glycosyltransferase involved in cell wall biosynthesis